MDFARTRLLGDATTATTADERLACLAVRLALRFHASGGLPSAAERRQVEPRQRHRHAVRPGERVRDGGAHVRRAELREHGAVRVLHQPVHRRLRVHQHLDIGEGDVDWDELFGSLREIGFDGTMTAAVFGNEHRARDSSEQMLQKTSEFIRKHW